MEVQNKILDAASVIQQLSSCIEVNQHNAQFSKFEKFDGEAVIPLMELMFATKAIFVYQSPAEFVDNLMELLDSHLFRSSYNKDEPNEEQVTINRTDGANMLFCVQQLIMLLCKSFTALQDFESATGMV